MIRNKSRAAAAAFALALAVAPVASAADITDSVTVLSSLTVTGIPATLSYGSLNPGQTSAVQHVPMHVVANSNWSVQVSGTDLGSIPKSAREGSMFGDPGVNVNDGPNVWGAFDTNYADGTQEATGTPGSKDITLDLRLTPPANTNAGLYSGTVSIVFSAT